MKISLEILNKAKNGNWGLKGVFHTGCMINIEATFRIDMMDPDIVIWEKFQHLINICKHIILAKIRMTVDLFLCVTWRDKISF